MAKPSYLNGLPPRDVELWKAQADFNADKVLVVVDRANVNAAATASAWSYSVPFKLVGENTNLVIPFSGAIGTVATKSSVAGTASTPAATVDIVMGSGTAVLSGDAAAWLAADTATLTFTYTNLRGATDTDTFVVTFA